MFPITGFKKARLCRGVLTTNKFTNIVCVVIATNTSIMNFEGKGLLKGVSLISALEYGVEW